MRGMGGQSGRVFECHVCHQVFTRRVSLTEHQYIHTNRKPYECLICGQTFRQMSNYKKHQKRHITQTDANSTSDGHSSAKQRTLPCSECGRVFGTKWSLSSHALSHSRSKTCLCDKCGHTFKYRSDLVRHLKIHDNLRQYKCDFCPIGFNDKSALKRHAVRVHPNSGESDANIAQTLNLSSGRVDTESINDLNDSNYVNCVIDFINVCRILPVPLPTHIYDKSVDLQKEIGVHLGCDDKCAKEWFWQLRSGLQELNQIIGEHLLFKYKSIII